MRIQSLSETFDLVLSPDPFQFVKHMHIVRLHCIEERSKLRKSEHATAHDRDELIKAQQRRSCLLALLSSQNEALQLGKDCAEVIDFDDNRLSHVWGSLH